MRFAISATLLAMLFFVSQATAKTWNILPSGGGDAPTIEAAIDSAMDGDTILLADSTFTGAGNRGLNLGSKDITLTATIRAIIDCEGQSRGITVSGGQGPSTVISNITIQNGAEGVGGGLVFAGDSAPTVMNVVVKDCTAASNGGGIYMIELLTAPTITDCVISGCSSGQKGGGISINDSHPLITMSTITGNSATDGAGIFIFGLVANPTITNNTISMNTASRNGGGVYSLEPLDFTLNGNVFYKNGAVNGGAIHFDFTTKATVENNTIAENSASGDGSGIFYRSSPITVHKAIIAFNTGSDGVGCSGVDPSTTCSILWMNNGGGTGDSVCGNTTNNRTADPLFCGSPGSFDYTINVTSPASVDSSLCNELIGAEPVDCGSTPVQSTTWGNLKSRYPR